MLRVRHDAASASQVRRAITDDLTGYAITRDSCDDIVLVASELVGNAVTHAHDRGDLDVEWEVVDGDSAVVVSVSDASSEQPRPRQASSSATSGRGLAIVAALAADWGVTELPDGKRVWARITVRHTS